MTSFSVTLHTRDSAHASSSTTSGADALSSAGPGAKKFSKVDRRYATEDERMAAESSIEDTNKRLETLSFDFNFS